MLTIRKNVSVVVIMVALLYCYKAAAVIEVDVELQLLLDVSASVDANEYNLQLEGYANAFLDGDVQSTILDGSTGKIAVQLIMWSGSTQQEVMIDWTLLDSEQALGDFATAILNIARPFSGWTAPGNAIDYAYDSFSANEYEGLRKIIDVSGDGVINSGISAVVAGDAAIAAGIDSINGIVITSDQDVIDYYQSEVVRGEDAFLLTASDYQAFQEAIALKIQAEIAGVTPDGAIVVSVPEPNSAFLLGGAIFLVLRIVRSKGN